MSLEIKGITKKFGALIANDSINLKVNNNEILAILGENGAGKSTLMKMFAGVTAPTSGTLRVSGKTAVFSSPRAASDAGIAMVLTLTPPPAAAPARF